MNIDVASFQSWLDENMVQGKKNVPARLVTLMGLLERLRETPELDLDAHRQPSGGQLIEHNSAVDGALARFSMESPLQERGRRSNNLNAFAPRLFDWLDERDFASMGEADRLEMITALQAVAVERVASILDEKPLLVRYNLGTPVAIFTDILEQAQVKNKAKEVAEYLVGAKLELRFGEGIVPIKNVNTPSLGNLADFRVGNTAIEVTVLKKPDRSHLDQIATILNDTRLQVWLLTRQTDCDPWRAAVEFQFQDRANRVVVAGIEMFLGQNLAEIGTFDIGEIHKAMQRLFARYNSAWVPQLGGGGLRVVNAEGDAHDDD